MTRAGPVGWPWWCVLVSLALFGLASGLARADQTQPGVAYLAVDLASTTAIASERPDMLDVPMLPGSVAKIATLAAALESGVINAHSGILCTRTQTVAGHQLLCTHPDLHRPLEPAEALAQSCNVYFATVASRLPRAAFDRALVSLGLPPSDASVSVAAAALGLAGTRSSPRQLLGMMARIGARPASLPWRPTTLSVVRDGLAGAARYGSASALGARGIDALAKTGTTVGSSGLAQGLVVGLTPAAAPTTAFVLVASGGAGMDAAELAADRLRPRGPVIDRVRIGVARPRGGYDVRMLALEDYVAGVVAGEAVPGSAPAAMEALAITVRTYALANLKRHEKEGFDLCDLTHCQVLRSASAPSKRAASATAGRVLAAGGRTASVFYTASCGGHRERPSAVWPGAADPSYLPSGPDTACGGEPAWTSDVAVADAIRALRTGGFKGDALRDVTITSRDASGRVSWLRLDGLAPPDISGDDFRTLIGRYVGWQLVRSTLFDLRRTGAGFHLEGRGAGHGVGLCVLGASRLAATGESATRILQRYFPGLDISVPARGEGIEPGANTARQGARDGVVQPQLAIVLPAADRPEEDAIRRLVSRKRDALAGALGVVAPVNLSFRFHPTVESYQRETGQPWFTAAATRGTDVQLLPLAALRQRGILETTIAHELAHVLVEPVLAGRPLWVLEGTAAHFAGEAAASEASGACPSDQEFMKPATPESLKQAYRRAAACVERQLRAGTPWRELR